MRQNILAESFPFLIPDFFGEDERTSPRMQNARLRSTVESTTSFSCKNYVDNPSVVHTFVKVLEI